MRKNLIHFLNHDFDYLIILSGDQLYRMDFRPVCGAHAEAGADMTVATIPVERAAVPALGIMQMDENWRITRFEEKPKDPAVQDPCGGTRNGMTNSASPAPRCEKIVSRVHGDLRFHRS